MCEHCNDDQMEIFKSDSGKWYLRVEGNAWDDYYDCFEHTDVQIDYCPHCGRKLD